VSSLKSSESFGQHVLDAIDAALSVLGGESVMRAFYYQLEKRSKITRDQIPWKLEVFHEALLELFDNGSVILERRICRVLYENLGLEYSVSEGKSLADCVEEALVKVNGSKAGSM
jgi:hypothetical protein